MTTDERDELTARIASLEMEVGKLNAALANALADVECWRIKREYALEQMQQTNETS